MFTVTDKVENKGDKPVSLRPYALILRRGTPKVGGYSVLHEGFVGVIGDGSVQEVTYAGIDKETDKVKELKGAGGWLGFTDKYWASAIIPGQTEQIDARFSATRPPQRREDYQIRFRRPGARRRARRFGVAVRRASSPARRKSRPSTPTQAEYSIKKFDLMIDWGWFYFITKPLFHLIDFIYKYRRQFRRGDPVRHRDRQGGVLPARQPELSLDGEDEAHCSRNSPR